MLLPNARALLGVSFLSLTVAVEANGETELNKKEPLVKPHGVLCAATHSCTVAYRGIPDPGRSLRALLPHPPSPLHPCTCSVLLCKFLPCLACLPAQVFRSLLLVSMIRYFSTYSSTSPSVIITELLSVSYLPSPMSSLLNLTQCYRDRAS